MCHPTMYVVTGLHLLMKTSLHHNGIMFEYMDEQCFPPFHTVDTVHLRHIKLRYKPTDAH
jgi:hypothetical protein